MDISTNDVLFLLGAVEVVACVGCALYWLIGRGSEARPARRALPSRPARPAAARRRVSRELHPAVSAQAVTAADDVAESTDLSDTGRHHVPDELLHSPTYRLSADLRARAKVPAPDRSHPIPGQVSRPVDQLSDAG